MNHPVRMVFRGLKANLSVHAGQKQALAIGQFHKPGETRLAVYLLTIVMVCRAYKSSLRMVFKAFERFDLESLSMTLGQGALLLVGFVVLRSGWAETTPGRERTPSR